MAGSVRSLVYAWRIACLVASHRPQRRAASYGKKVALIESTSKLGGTCVNVGEYLAQSRCVKRLYARPISRIRSEGFTQAGTFLSSPYVVSFSTLVPSL